MFTIIMILLLQIIDNILKAVLVRNGSFDIIAIIINNISTAII